ncbi:MAG TPA: ATP-dependent helicase [Bacteroidia bacterium]|nr:ATP-dependent helicase [Bacteroidia bacterium]
MAFEIKNISSDTKIDSIEEHFKVTAGPGAGKTRWLISHIRHVLQNSVRLGNTRKIACITYTNVAAETILERLGVEVDRVEVSTIHSFLYKNLVKPFAFLIPSEHELDITKLDGHDDVPVYKGLLYEWKTKTSQAYITDDNKIIKALSDLAWQFDTTNNLILRPKKPYLGKISSSLSIRKDSYFVYKKMCWNKGLVDHDDILFFSLDLITRFPRLLDIVRAKFPYFFLDEFQDTNPIQTAIITKIAENETIIGVVGDKAQSIYGFQGAKPEQFNNFSLPGIQVYSISDNHRCSNKIAVLLNQVRSDISQVAKRNVEGISPTILVGEKTWAMNKSFEVTRGEVYSLSRSNITSNLLREGVGLFVAKANLLDEIRENDSNTERANILIACITATELGRQSRYKEALKSLSKEIKRAVQKEEIPKQALLILKFLLEKHSTFKPKNLMDFYTIIAGVFPKKISGFRAGSAKTFYEKNIYEIVALSVNIKEDTSLHRTIHKAKGAEFKHVMVVLEKNDKGNFEEQNELGFILNSNLDEDEEHRVRYVGISRAKDSLFINVPSLTDEAKNKLAKKGFDFLFEKEMQAQKAI